MAPLRIRAGLDSLWNPLPSGKHMGTVCSDCRENKFSHASTHQTILILSSPLLSGASRGGEPKNSCLKLNVHFPLLARCEHYLLTVSFPSRLAFARKSHLDTVLQHSLLHLLLYRISLTELYFQVKKKNKNKNQLSPLSSFFGVISLW